MNEQGVQETSDSFIGNINPFRYRGYYYDAETGFYYLQTRYYDPEVCRFINADDYELIATLAEIPGQLNLYAYCNNNPIMFTDESGTIIGWLAGVLAIFLFTPVGGIVTQVAVSSLSYVGMAVASIWDEDIRADMKAIGWDPFNSNGNLVLSSNKVSFYKGVPVFRTNNGRSGSFGAIFLKRGVDIDELNHERGHNLQLMMMGLGTFGFSVGIPSPLELGRWANTNYYGAPWETMADILGGVQGRKHSDEEIVNAWIYYGLSMGNLPLAALYWI